MVAEWLNQYCSSHPPLEGDEFIEQLFSVQPVRVLNTITGRYHHVNPFDLANRILLTREDLARNVAEDLPFQSARQNVKILRAHLERHTYTSGTSDMIRVHYRKGNESKCNKSLQAELGL